MFDGLKKKLKNFRTFLSRSRNRPKNAKKGLFLAFVGLYLNFVTNFGQKKVAIVILSKSGTCYKIFSQIGRFYFVDIILTEISKKI